MTREIQLTQGKVALVDDADYEFLSRWKWHACRSRGKWYARRNERLGNGKRILVQMQHVLCGKGSDHKDGDGLNNQRDNLRVATHHQNCLNRPPKKGSSSKYKGVSWYKRGKSWGAYIKLDGKQYHLGRFSTEEEAARAYDAAALHLHGEFAWLNFPAQKTDTNDRLIKGIESLQAAAVQSTNGAKKPAKVAA